ncbi:polysaccharide deacetylase family protein [Chloroflexota bacterium]
MIDSLKTVAATAANYSGLPDGYAFLRRKLTKSQVGILLYHRVCPSNDNWNLKPLSPRSFERQMEYFHRNYEILSLDRLVQYIQQGRPLPEKAVVITFDDGYKDNYLYAYPILVKHGIPATIFLTTGHIGSSKLFWFDEVKYLVQLTPLNQLELNELGSYPLQTEVDRFRTSLIISRRLRNLPEERKKKLVEKLINTCQVDIPDNLGEELFLSWDEVREMGDDGISFGAHTVNHPVLTNLPLQRARWEIVQSKKDIEEKLGKEVTAFAYPFGPFNAEIVRLVKESGFTSAVTTESGLVNAKTNPYKLPRIGAVRDFNKFKVVFSGLYQDLRLGRLLK